MIGAYRASGAELPYGDLSRARHSPFEGWFWRLSDPRDGRVIIAFCGISHDRSGARWGTVGLADHPSRTVNVQRTSVTEASTSAAGLGVRIGTEHDVARLKADAHGVQLRLGDDASLDAQIEQLIPWPRRAFGACGPAHLVPGFAQLWHPHLLHGRVNGTAVVRGETISLDGWEAYAEKNWGPGGFPARWWWGQAHGFDEQACVAFAGGRIGSERRGLTATAVVLAVGDEVVRLVPPSAIVRTEIGTGQWRISAVSPRYRITVEGAANGTPPHRLPVPLPLERRHHEDAAVHHPAGTITVTAQRGRRRWFSGSSRLAGLETGTL